MIGALLALAFGAAPVHAFRIAGEWVVLDDRGQLVARYAHVSDEPIFDGDVVPDGSFFVFSLAGEGGPGRLVKWKVGTPKLEMFVEERGFYGAPRFSRDGSWLFVAHYPLSGGPPGEHATMEYAQLYRINVESRQMQKLTASNGCHMSSFSNDGRELVFGHSTCKGQKYIERLTASGSLVSTNFQAETRVVETGGLLDEPVLSTDGATLVFSRTNGSMVELVALVGKKLRVLFAGPSQGALRTVVTAQNEVLFQHGRRVLSVSLVRDSSPAVVFEA